MNNDYIFRNGKMIETFNFINHNDLNNDYIGHLIEYKNTVYQVVTDGKNKLIDPNEPAEIVSENINYIYDYMDELENSPINIGTEINIPDTNDGAMIIDGKLVYHGRVIEPILDDEDEIDNFEYDEASYGDEYDKPNSRNEIDVEEYREDNGNWY